MDKKRRLRLCPGGNFGPVIADLCEAIACGANRALLEVCARFTEEDEPEASEDFAWKAQGRRRSFRLSTDFLAEFREGYRFFIGLYCGRQTDVWHDGCPIATGGLPVIRA